MKVYSNTPTQIYTDLYENTEISTSNYFKKSVHFVTRWTSAEVGGIFTIDLNGSRPTKNIRMAIYQIRP